MDSPLEKLRLTFWSWRQKMKYQIKHTALFFWPFYCRWHKDDIPVSYNPSPESTIAYAYCPECGCMLWTKTCLRCGKDFLDFSSQGSDDLMASAAVTSSGDLMCINCARRYEDEEEERESEDADCYDYDEIEEDI